MCLPLFERPDIKKNVLTLKSKEWSEEKEDEKKTKQTKSLSRTLMQSHMSRRGTLFSSVFVPFQHTNLDGKKDHLSSGNGIKGFHFVC